LSALKEERKRTYLLALASAVGFEVGFLAGFFIILTLWEPTYRGFLIGAIGGLVGGGALGLLALRNWKRVAILALASALGFAIAVEGDWKVFRGLTPQVLSGTMGLATCAASPLRDHGIGYLGRHWGRFIGGRFGLSLEDEGRHRQTRYLMLARAAIRSSCSDNCNRVGKRLAHRLGTAERFGTNVKTLRWGVGTVGLLLLLLAVWQILAATQALPWFLAVGEAAWGAGIAGRIGWWLGHSGLLAGGLLLALRLSPELGFIMIILPLFPIILGFHALAAAPPAGRGH
jgi:hypothetical protein